MNQQLFLLILVIILTVTFMVEVAIGSIADFIAEWLISPAGIATFIAVTVVFAVGGILILRYTNKIKKNSAMHTSVTVVHYVLIAIIAFVVAQILVTEQYNSLSILIVVSISNGLWVVILSLLSKAFISWIRATGPKKKRNVVVLVLTLSMIAYVVNGMTSLVTELAEWPAPHQQKPEVVTSEHVAFFPDFKPDSLADQIEVVYITAANVAYVLSWIGTVMLLRPYVHRIGKIKFYAIMGAAMVYFMIDYPLFILGYYTPTEETEQDVMNNILIFGMASLLSGVIFGAAFLSVARTLKKDNPLRGYMMIAAYGFILFYVAGSAAVTQLAYPPYGLASYAFVGLSTYLIYVGLYFAAVSVSQDYQIRDSIRKSAAKEIRFLEDMGMAHMQQERQDAVLLAAKKNAEMLAEETGVKPSLDEGDMKEYLDEVLKEIENITTKTKK